MKPLSTLAALLLLLPSTLAAQAPTPVPPRAGLKPLEGVASITSEIGGRTFEQWKVDLKHSDPSVRSEAILAIALFGNAATEAIPLLLDRCLDRDASPRVKAVLALTVLEIPEREFCA